MEELKNRAYAVYKRVWIKEHQKELNSCYVCFDEFVNNEFQDKHIVRNYLSKSDFNKYKKLMK